ncbi:sigma-E factor negative regulatory protein [Rhodoferax sp. 4810]|nr:sigma-E factor negative regulatory protein [Rhodoferax jenense]
MSDQLRERCERVSALVDGQIRGEEFARTVADLANSPEAQDTWDTYHLIGAAMRSSGEPLRTHDPAFVARLRTRLADETIENIAASPLPIRAEGQKGLKNSAANDPWWKRVVGLASVALVGVLAWQGVALMGSAGGGDNGSAQLAKAPTPVAPAVAPATLVAADGSQMVMIRDPQLDAMLAAHRQMGGATALQMPSGFLRNATFDESKR